MVEVVFDDCRDRRLNVCEANFTLSEAKQHDRSEDKTQCYIKPSPAGKVADTE